MVQNKQLFSLFLTSLLISIILILRTFTTNSMVYPKNDLSTTTYNFPGAYVKYLYPKPSNESYCTFNYDLPLEFMYSPSHIDFGPELGNNASYRILYNVIAAKIGPEVPGVTYVTHVSADFINYITELVRYFEGPISVAIFVLDYDSILVLQQLIQFCFCVPEMSRVSIHFVFHETSPPKVQSVNDFAKVDTCDVAESSPLKGYQKKSMYPINVCRNAARTAAMTDFVLVSDIELMPSEGLASRFLRMLQAQKVSKSDFLNKGFVVPIFEVERTELIPRNKEQLLKLVREEKAVYFHKVICTHCQKFPGIEYWLETDPGDRIEVFNVVKREVPYNRWEPIYIGTKNEPLYNEALSWEGLQDKMLQMLEMCLLGYELVILDGAFLVHWPGIKKHKTRDKEFWREPFVNENQRQYDKILDRLSKKYEANPKCKLK